MAMALVRYRFRGRSTVDFFVFMPLSSPEVVLGAALLAMFLTLNINTGFVTIVIAHVMFTMSYVVVTVKARLEGMDRHIEEASMDLGATEWVTFRKITLPMIAPGVAAAAMLAAAISFDDYVITSFNAGQTQTFPLFIFGATRQGVPGRGQRAGDDAAARRAGPDGPQRAGAEVARAARSRPHRRLRPLTPSPGTAGPSRRAGRRRPWRSPPTRAVMSSTATPIASKASRACRRWRRLPGQLRADLSGGALDSSASLRTSSATTAKPCPPRRRERPRSPRLALTAPRLRIERSGSATRSRS